MRNALCLGFVALALAVPVAAERESGTRRRGAEQRQPDESGRQDVAVLAVTAIGGSTLVFATRDGFFATGVRLAPDLELRTWTVGWPATAA